MGQRVDLQTILSQIIGDSKRVYFQPPANVEMNYPAIVYHRDNIDIERADNKSYMKTTRYQVTVIDRDPDSELPGKIADLPLCSYSRAFKTDGLNHDIFQLYF